MIISIFAVSSASSDRIQSFVLRRYITTATASAIRSHPRLRAYSKLIEYTGPTVANMFDNFYCHRSFSADLLHPLCVLPIVTTGYVLRMYILCLLRTNDPPDC